MRRALVLTGGLASGKTVVAKDLVELASERGWRLAAIDVDWLAWETGARVGLAEVITRNLRSVAENFDAVGIDRLVLARSLLEPGALDVLRRGLPGWSVDVVRLDVPQDVARRRLEARDSGAELDEHLAEVDAVARRAAAAVPEAPAVVNDSDGGLRSVTLAVLAAARWIDD